MSPRFSSTSAAIAFAATVLTGGAAVPDAGLLLNEQRGSREELRRPLSAQDAPQSTLPAAIPSATPNAGLVVTLHEVRFSGGEGLASAAELQRVVAPSLGRELNHAALQLLAQDVTVFLRAQGYVLARAYLPKQDVTDGTLEIAIVDGRLEAGDERVTVESNARISSDRIKAIANEALPAGVLRGADLERAILLINDLPGVTARSGLERGSDPGTSRLSIDASQSDLFTSRLSVDNFSNRSTGSLRGTAQIGVIDPLKLGDAFGLALSGSSGTFVAASDYSLPVGSRGARVDVNASYLRYEVGGELKALELEGDAVTGAIGVGYPVIRTRKTNLSVHLDYEQKRLADDALGTNLRDLRLDHFGMMWSGSHFDDFGGGGAADASLSLVYGWVDLSGNAVDQLTDNLTARTHGSFEKLTLRVSRLQSLGRLDGGKWSLFASATGQLAGGNLDSSEKFILGGPNGVRAYPMGEAAGDRGWLTSVELRRAITIARKYNAQALGFFDAGGVNLNYRPWAGSIVNIGRTNNVGLAGAGFGANLWAGRWVVRVAVAQAIDNNPGRSLAGHDADGRSSRQRAWLQTSMSF